MGISIGRQVHLALFNNSYSLKLLWKLSYISEACLFFSTLSYTVTRRGSMLSRYSGIAQIAAVYVGTVVGAGFATGREIVEFFTKYGFYGFLGILIAGCLFILLGTKIMILTVEIQARSYQELNSYLFGKKWGFYINILFFVMLFGVTAVMLSGAGSVFEEQLGMSKMFGVACTTVLALIVLHKGIKGLFAINLLVVPTMILFSFILFFNTLENPFFFDNFFKVSVEVTNWHSIISPFLYSAFNLALAQAVLVPVAFEIQDRAIIKKGGVLGGICLTLILLTSHLSLQSLPSVMNYDIPTAELMKNFAHPFYWIFILVIFGEIFTSLVGNVFGLERQLQQFINMKSIIVFVFLLLSSYLVSYIPYRTLLSNLYPVFGYVSLLFLILLLRSGMKKQSE